MLAADAWRDAPRMEILQTGVTRDGIGEDRAIARGPSGFCPISFPELASILTTAARA